MLANQRALFSLPKDLHYLNCAYMAPLPRPVEEAGRLGLSRKINPTTLEAKDFYEPCDAVRRQFARLVRLDDAERIAILPAVSYGIATVARNTTITKSQNIVLLEHEFPSNFYSWRRLCDDSGAELRTVRAPAEARHRGRIWNDKLLHAIDSATILVSAPQVHWSDGTLFDLETVGRRCREVGAALVVDGTQSVGALPFDLETIKPDALFCAGYKWLLGPYGVGLAYYGSRYDDGIPLEENWIARRNSEDFASLVDYQNEYQPGAVRFDVGERSNPISIPMLSAALGLLLEWTPEAIQESLARLVAEPLARLAERGFEMEEPAWRGAHLFGIRPPRGISRDSLVEAMRRHRVAASVRGSAIRVAPHLYNDAADLEALCNALESTLSRQAVPTH